MASIEQKDWNAVGDLYKTGNSMRSIADSLGVSIDAVTYVLRKTGVPRRSPQETNRIVFSRKPFSFTIREPINQNEKTLQSMGAMLYWAEGYKTKKATGIDFANSDPQMVKFFITFMRSRYIFDEKRLRVLLYCYENQDPKSLIRYWSRLLQIPAFQFTKPYVRKKTTTSLRIMKYGMVHIRYSDKKMLNDLLNLIHSYVLKFSAYPKEISVGGRPKAISFALGRKPQPPT